MFNAAAAMRRLHDGNLSGKFILIPVCIFIISVLLIILLRVIPGDITPYLPYLTLCSNLMDQLSILFLAMMLIKRNNRAEQVRHPSAKNNRILKPRIPVEE